MSSIISSLNKVGSNLSLPRADGTFYSVVETTKVLIAEEDLKVGFGVVQGTTGLKVKLATSSTDKFVGVVTRKTPAGLYQSNADGDIVIKAGEECHVKFTDFVTVNIINAVQNTTDPVYLNVDDNTKKGWFTNVAGTNNILLPNATFMYDSPTVKEKYHLSNGVSPIYLS